MKRILAISITIFLLMSLPAFGADAPADPLQEAKAQDKKVAELKKAGKSEEAIPYAKKSLELCEKSLGREHPDVAVRLNWLASLYKSTGKYVEAEALYKRAIAIDEKMYGKEHKEVATDLNSLARLYDDAARYSEAEPLYKRVLEIREKVLGKEHKYVGENLHSLAMVYYMTGRYAEAEPLYKRAIAIWEKTLGKEHIYVARGLNNLALLYYDTKRYAEAESLFNRSLQIREKLLGKEHLDVATVLNSLAGLYESTKQYAEAELLYKRVLAIKEKVLGKEHPDVAISLNNLANLYYNTERYAEAEPLYQRLLVIQEKVLGPEHTEVATTLNYLANTLYGRKNYIQAEPLYLRALAITEKAHGPNAPFVATICNNLGNLYTDTKAFVKAEPMYLRTLTIQEKVLGPEHTEVATTLNHLADTLYGKDKYVQAEPLYLRALAITEKAHGPNAPFVSTICNNLGYLYSKTKAFVKAEPMYLRAQGIREKLYGEESGPAADQQVTLANFYYNAGNLTKAEAHYLRAAAIREKVFGKDHLDVADPTECAGLLAKQRGDFGRAEPLLKHALAIYEKEKPHDLLLARCLDHLATLYKAMGDDTRAKAFWNRSFAVENSREVLDKMTAEELLAGMAHQIYARGAYSQVPLLQNLDMIALSVQEKKFGPEHPEVGNTLVTIADHQLLEGNCDKAEPLLSRALAIREKEYGPNHFLVADVLLLQARLQNELGNFNESAKLYLKAISIKRKALGPEHPDVASAWRDVALMLGGVDGYEETAKLGLTEAQKIDDRVIDQVLGFGSEAQQLNYLAARKWSLHVYMDLLIRHLSTSLEARRMALDTWLQRKGLVLESQKRFQQIAIRGEESKVQDTFDSLAKVRAQLSELTFKGPGTYGAEAHQKRLVELDQRKADLEGQLNLLSQAFAHQTKKASADTAAVAAALPTGSVLVEFARLEQFRFKAKINEEHWNPPRYFAFVLPAKKAADVQIVDLGNAESLDKAIGDFRAAVSSRDKTRHYSAEVLSRDLCARVFTPLLAALGSNREVFLSPDGALSLLPFEVLKAPSGRFLVEDFTFAYLATGRDLLDFTLQAPKGGKSLVVGDPDFDLRTEVGMPLTGAEDRSRDISGLHFEPLPGTRVEAQRVHHLLGEAEADLLLGNQALEARLTHVHGPKVLHLATHGFFLRDQEPGPWKDVRGITIAGITGQAAQPASRYENPLLRTGLALAGANRALGPERRPDGLLTAEKILNLDLKGTAMVVLSACETGLGEVRAGEGVFGLRRAFAQAGARSQVMSLWAVPDKETQELMTAFYTNLAAGKPRHKALRQAALEQLARVQKRYGSPDPFYWGAFVFLGDPE